MNFLPTFGILAVLLFAYCTPTRGQAIAVSNVEFHLDGKKYTSGSNKSTNLIKSSDDAFKIEETRDGKTSPVATFGIETIYTMLGTSVILRTNVMPYLKMELVNSQDSQRLFDMTTRSKLGKTRYSYEVSAVYEYQKNCILGYEFFSEFVEYSPAGNPLYRYVIHSGAALSTEMQPRLVWTRDDFNYYFTGGNDVLLVLRAKREDKQYRYYLVKFRDKSDLTAWEKSQDKYWKTYIPAYPREVYKYFKEFF